MLFKKTPQKTYNIKTNLTHWKREKQYTVQREARKEDWHKRRQIRLLVRITPRLTATLEDWIRCSVVTTSAYSRKHQNATLGYRYVWKRAHFPGTLSNTDTTQAYDTTMTAGHDAEVKKPQSVIAVVGVDAVWRSIADGVCYRPTLSLCLVANPGGQIISKPPTCSQGSQLDTESRSHHRCELPGMRHATIC